MTSERIIKQVTIELLKDAETILPKDIKEALKKAELI